MRRLLDIVACTTRFSKSRNTRSPPSSESRSKKNGSRPHQPTSNTPAPSDDRNGLRATLESDGASFTSPISSSWDMAAIRPTPKLSEFYDFFSFSHLSPPILRKFILIYYHITAKLFMREDFVPFLRKN